MKEIIKESTKESRKESRKEITKQTNKKFIIFLIVAAIIIITACLKIFILDPYLKKIKKQSMMGLASSYYKGEEYLTAKNIIINDLHDYYDDKDVMDLLNKIINDENEKIRLRKLDDDKRREMERKELLDLIYYLISQNKKKYIYEDKKDDVVKKNDVKYIDEKKRSNIPEADLLIKEGIIAYNEKRYAVAKSNFMNALKFDEDNPYALSYLASTLIEENPEDDSNIEEAVKLINRAFQVDKDIKIAHYTLAKIYSIRKLYNLAIDEYKITIKLDPNDYEVWFDLGMIYYEIKDYENAKTNLLNSVDLKTDFIPGYYYLGKVEFAWNNFTLSRQYFNKAISIDPNFYNAYVSLGDVYKEEKDYKNAIIFYERAIQIENNYEFYYKTGECHELLGNMNDAVLSYINAINLCPLTNLKGKNFILVMYQKIINIKNSNADYIGALDFTNRGIEKLGVFSHVLYYIAGDLSMKLDKYTDAINYYYRVIEINSEFNNDYEIQYKIGLCYKKAKNLNKAIEYLEKSLSLNDKFADTYFDLGECYYIQKKYDKAETIFNQLTDKYPDYRSKELEKILNELNKK